MRQCAHPMKTAGEAAARLGRVGVWSFELERMTATDEGRLARQIEGLGFKALWIPESLGSKEIFAHAAILLAATKTLIVASGIANIWARDAVAMANGARTLQEAYADRFLCGLGVSHKPTIDVRLGRGYTKPLPHIPAHLDAMDKAPFTGPNREDPPVPRVIAALAPDMLKLSAQRSLGAHPYFVPPEHTAIARKTLGADPLLAVEQAVTLETDAVTGRETARTHMKRYLGLDNYTNNLRRLGWGDADIANGGSDTLVDAIVGLGDVRPGNGRLGAPGHNGADPLRRTGLRIH